MKPWHLILPTVGLAGVILAIRLTQPTGATEDSSQAAPAPRTATVSEIVNVVEGRRASDPFTPIENGAVLGEGSEIRTGDESKARLGFSEGTIVRVSANSSVTIHALTVAGDGPLSRLRLEAGKLWVSLRGGMVEVETPIGVAAVRGSFAVFEYYPGAASGTDDDVLILNCIEGSCSAASDWVDEALGNLERIELSAGGRDVARDRLTAGDVQDFARINPDVGQAVVATLTAAPPATVTPVPASTDPPVNDTPVSPAATAQEAQPGDTPTPPATGVSEASATPVSQPTHDKSPTPEAKASSTPAQTRATATVAIQPLPPQTQAPTESPKPTAEETKPPEPTQPPPDPTQAPPEKQPEPTAEETQPPVQKPPEEQKPTQPPPELLPPQPAPTSTPGK